MNIAEAADSLNWRRDLTQLRADADWCRQYFVPLRPWDLPSDLYLSAYRRTFWNTHEAISDVGVRTPHALERWGSDGAEIILCAPALGYGLIHALISEAFICEPGRLFEEKRLTVWCLLDAQRVYMMEHKVLHPLPMHSKDLTFSAEEVRP